MSIFVFIHFDMMLFVVVGILLCQDSRRTPQAAASAAAAFGVVTSLHLQRHCHVAVTSLYGPILWQA